MDDRKKLRMDSADPQNHSEWGGRLRGRTVNQDRLLAEETCFEILYDDDSHI